MEFVYVKWLICYLNKYINLDGYDKKIKNSELYYVPIKDEKIDYYQEKSRPYLEYFYIRNDVEIDKLSDNEKKFIDDNKNIEYNEEIEKFIVDTMNKVLFKEFKEGRVLTTYGSPAKKYLAYNDSIVIGFRFDEYNNDKKLERLVWSQNYFDKLKYLKEIGEEIKRIGKERLNRDITVIIYNEYTVTNRK